jgi:predicted house-cleaning noncanonical NTP pyrophosphatase (MazG superfamily)
MKYNKLVRDKIPEIIKERGGNSKTHIADDEEYKQKLKEKLREEVDEFLENDNIYEFVDILEVLDAICDYRNFEKTELLDLKDKKAEERGRFKKKIILDES